MLLSLLPAPSLPVVYEANLRAEGDSRAFVHLQDRLPWLRQLGVDVLWLMPVQPVGKIRSAGGLGSPYAIADYDGLNPEFGSEADFKALVAKAHGSGMRVILDWVANHTAWDHPWIKAHPEWYTLDAKGQIAIPAGTNWQDVADLDFTRRPMRAAMIRAMQGWVTRYGIDGFRCDAADMVPADFWSEAIRGLRTGNKPLLMLAEGAREDHYAAGFDLIYGWDAAYRTKEAYAGAKAGPVVAAVRVDDAKTPAGKGVLRFSTNHDWSAWDGDPIELYKTADGVKGGMILSTLLGGAPLIYTGQEVGWPRRIPIFDRTLIDWKSGQDSRAWLKTLLNARKTFPALREGTTIDLSTDDVVGFRRKSSGGEAMVFVNVRDHATTVSIPEDQAGRWRTPLTPGYAQVDRSLKLGTYQSLVLVR